MMDYGEMDLAIRTFEEITKLDNYLVSVTGSGLSGSRFEGINSISDLLFRNCIFYDEYSDEAFDRFMSIMTDVKLDADDKRNKLWGNDPDKMGRHVKHITREEEDRIFEKALDKTAKKLDDNTKNMLCYVMKKYVNHEMTKWKSIMGEEVDCIAYKLQAGDNESPRELGNWYSNKILEVGIDAKYGRKEEGGIVCIPAFALVGYDNDDETLYISINEEFAPYVPMLMKVLQA